MDFHEEEGGVPHVGLGFHQNAGGGGGSNGADPSVGAGGLAADALMRSYVEQCLEYHRSAVQMQQAEGGQQGQQQQQQQLSFVPAANTKTRPQPHRTDAAAGTEMENKAAANVNAAIENARAIARKFHAQHQHQQEEVAAAYAAPTVTSSSSSSVPPVPVVSIPIQPTPAPSEHRLKRERFALQHSRRLRLALLRNFEYVAKRDEEGMRLHALELERRKLESQQVGLRMDRNLQSRMKAVEEARKKSDGVSLGKATSSKSGIGTSSRRNIERKKERDGHSRKRPRQDLDDSVYISGLPTDGSVKEEELRRLFGCYGKVRNVVMYIEKRTGRLKGDGLIGYELCTGDDATERRKLMEAVCSQLNGVELPCGATLKVEPADPDWRNDSGKAKNGRNAGERGLDVIEGEKDNLALGSAIKNVGKAKATESKTVEDGDAGRAGGAGGEHDDDDLDDFFASL